MNPVIRLNWKTGKVSATCHINFSPLNYSLVTLALMTDALNVPKSVDRPTVIHTFS